MIQKDEVTALRAEVKELKKEVAGLKEFIRAMYSMMSEEEDYDDSLGSSGFGRYNT
jgi:cell division protein FtsB